jgi:hypothetical protein
MKIQTSDHKIREVVEAVRMYSVFEEKDGTLWLVDKTGFASRISMVGKAGQVLE